MPKIEWSEVIVSMRSAVGGAEKPAVEYELRDPFRVLVSTIISLRTKDEVTAIASRRLLRRAPNPRTLVDVDEVEIQQLIFPAGFYRNKARHLRETARQLIDRFSGKVPTEMDDLLSLPGVGRKTANLVRNLGYGLPGICVDTHVHRISNRLGWVQTTGPDKTEKALEEVLPEEHWIPINGLMVRFGKTICTPISPFCSRCPLSHSCPRRGVTRTR